MGTPTAEPTGKSTAMQSFARRGGNPFRIGVPLTSVYNWCFRITIVSTGSSAIKIIKKGYFVLNSAGLLSSTILTEDPLHLSAMALQNLGKRKPSLSDPFLKCIWVP